jgi:large subunit ribosomal protein L18
MATYNRRSAHQRAHRRLRKKVAGTSDRPRLAVNFSGRHVYAQLIDDVAGHTLVAACTTEKTLAGKGQAHANSETAAKVGKTIAERAQKANIKQVVFDRGGFRFHGKVKSLADAAREGGLDF